MAKDFRLMLGANGKAASPDGVTFAWMNEGADGHKTRDILVCANADLLSDGEGKVSGLKLAYRSSHSLTNGYSYNALVAVRLDGENVTIPAVTPQLVALPTLADKFIRGVGLGSRFSIRTNAANYPVVPFVRKGTVERLADGKARLAYGLLSTTNKPYGLAFAGGVNLSAAASLTIAPPRKARKVRASADRGDIPAADPFDLLGWDEAEVAEEMAALMGQLDPSANGAR